MKTITIAKASPLRGQTIEDVTITITGEPPKFAGDDWQEQAHLWHECEAADIVNALRDSLPGGTLDAILAELLIHRASLLRVAYGPQEVKP